MRQICVTVDNAKQPRRLLQLCHCTTVAVLREFIKYLEEESTVEELSCYISGLWSFLLLWVWHRR